MRTVRVVSGRALALALLWWVLSEGRPGYAVSGGVVVLLALAASIVLAPVPAPAERHPTLARPSARVVGLAVLIGWYAVQIIRGGLDVTGRLLRRRTAVAPVVVETRTHLPAGRLRPLAVAMYNLMPGSLVCGMQDDLIRLHSLAAELEARQQWHDLEDRLARASGIALPPG